MLRNLGRCQFWALAMGAALSHRVCAVMPRSAELRRYVVERNRSFPVSYLKVSIPELD